MKQKLVRGRMFLIFILFYFFLLFLTMAQTESFAKELLNGLIPLIGNTYCPMLHIDTLL